MGPAAVAYALVLRAEREAFQMFKGGLRLLSGTSVLQEVVVSLTSVVPVSQNLQKAHEAQWGPCAGLTQCPLQCLSPVIMQVCTGGLRLLSGTSVLQEVAVESLAALVPAFGPPGSPGSTFISGAAVGDPYVALQLSDDRALLLCANHETGEMAAMLECLHQQPCGARPVCGAELLDHSS